MWTADMGVCARSLGTAIAAATRLPGTREAKGETMSDPGSKASRAAARAALAAVAGCAACSVGTAVAVDPACVLDGADAESEPWPGYPYAFDAFKADIAPVLASDCAGAGCHGPAAPPEGGRGGFTVFGRAAGGCDL